jgi:hypothetical protein
MLPSSQHLSELIIKRGAVNDKAEGIYWLQLNLTITSVLNFREAPSING